MTALRLTGRKPRVRDGSHVVAEGNFAAGYKGVTAGDAAVVAAGPPRGGGHEQCHSRTLLLSQTIAKKEESRNCGSLTSLQFI